MLDFGTVLKSIIGSSKSIIGSSLDQKHFFEVIGRKYEYSYNLATLKLACRKMQKE